MGKKAEAEKGHTKLLLLHICGDICNKALSNIALAKPSKGMLLVMTNERSGQASAFSDIMRKGLTVAKKHDPNDIRSRELSLTNLLLSSMLPLSRRKLPQKQKEIQMTPQVPLATHHKEINMAQQIKHVGKTNDRKVLVLYREVPGDEHMCLVIYPEVLNASWQDAIQKVVESEVGQQANQLADALQYCRGGSPGRVSPPPRISVESTNPTPLIRRNPSGSVHL
jgi:hypothetical protein